jgi:nucleoside-diphosphate-sugar epimerase
MRVLITGASGFIGRNLVSALPADWRVTATWRHAQDFPAFLATRGLAHVTPVRIDLADAAPEAVDASLGSQFDAAILLAANGDPAVSVRRPRFDLASNALSLVALLERVRIGRAILLSSGAVYDGLRGEVRPGIPVWPTLPYAISKLAAEHYLRAFTRSGAVGSAVAVRFFGAYGPHEPGRKIYTRLVRAFALEGRREFTIRGDGRNLIDAMYVDDAVEAIRRLLEAPAAGTDRFEIVDLASGTPLSIEQLVRTAAATFGVEPRIAFEGEVPEHIEFRSGDPTMREHHAFQPRIPLPDGLRRLAAHLAAGAEAGPTAAAGPS